MTEYHKIQSVWKRDPETNHKSFLVGEWSVDAFAYLAQNDWEYTEKVDGTNIRVVTYPTGGFSVFGKSDRASIPDPLLARIIERFKPYEGAKLQGMFPEGAVLYGEGYGGKIQSGGKYRKDQDLVLFDVLVGPYWLNRMQVNSIANSLGLDVVPIIGAGNLFRAITLAESGFKSCWGDFTAEGIVARPSLELRTRAGERVITKVKYRDFHNE